MRFRKYDTKLPYRWRLEYDDGILSFVWDLSSSKMRYCKFDTKLPYRSRLQYDECILSFV